MQGLTIEKNGNMKLTLNLGAQIIVETAPNTWKDARTFFMTLAVKGRVYVNETVNSEGKTIKMLNMPS